MSGCKKFGRANGNMKYCLDCNKLKSRKGNYCRKCGYRHRIRPSGLVYKIKVINKGWFVNKGGWTDEKGYKRVKIGGKNIREHVFIISNFLCRKLYEHEVVHHINGNKTDNRLDNLQVVNKVDHDKFHGGIKKKDTGYRVGRIYS